MEVRTIIRKYEAQGSSCIKSLEETINTIGYENVLQIIPCTDNRAVYYTIICEKRRPERSNSMWNLLNTVKALKSPTSQILAVKYGTVCNSSGVSETGYYIVDEINNRRLSDVVTQGEDFIPEELNDILDSCGMDKVF